MINTTPPLVVIIGEAGHGKTTFVNKICNTRQKTMAGGFYTTDNVFYADSAYGDGFYVTDTPGFKSNKQIHHMIAIKFALTTRKLNRILIVVKYEKLNNMIINIRNILFMLNNYKDLICLVVTHWDVLDQNDTSETNPEDELYKNVIQKLQIKEYILSRKDTSGEILCKQIDKFLKNSQQKEISITDTGFFSQFEVQQLDKYNFEMNQQCQKLIQVFKQKCDICIQFIEKQNPDQNEDLYDILHTLITMIRKESKSIIKQFQNEQAITCDQLLEKFDNDIEFAYAFPMYLKKEISQFLEQVIQLAQQKMQKCKNWKIYENLKKCPKCGMIWLNVNKICWIKAKCGGFAIKDDVEFEPQPPKYTIEIKEEISIRKNQNKQQKNWFNIFNIYNPMNYFKELKGCSAETKWDEWINLDKNEIQELLNLGFLDILSMTEEDIQSLKKVNFQETLNNITDQVEKNIQSEIKKLPKLLPLQKNIQEPQQQIKK